MPLIAWKKTYEIGIESIDHEHREMIELINALYAELDSGPSESEVARFLGEILSKISAHFALEEKVMRELEYLDYDAHKENHEDLLEEIRDIMDRYEDGAYAAMKDELVQNLEIWFTEHFKNKDSLLHRFLDSHT